MIILRDFDVVLGGEVVDRVTFIGPEYTEETVRDFLITHDKTDRHIIVKLVREVHKK